mmetsp:Transcript_20630/g.26087  ORF Transcript_20630/g.26087 Transcript_20630/m.26087 type:complete len:596 (-) Transcript_20630:46-1833(-)
MNIINMLKNVAFMVDPGPDENSPLWKMLESYQTALANEEPTDDICTLEEVLESKDVISFLQHNHQPLTSFLTEKDHLKKLLEYITTCPESKTILSQQSCKILCHNVASVREAVFQDATDNLDILFGFEDEDQMESETLKNLDAMHSGLLTQVVQKFLNTHNWYMVDYFSSKDALKENPEQLLSSPGLLQTLVDTNYCYSGSALGQWMESINMVGMLVSAFKGDKGPSAVTCAAEVLSSIIQAVSPLLQQLESREIVTQLLNDAFNPENPCSEVAQTEVITVCQYLADKFQNEGCESVPDPLAPILEHLAEFNAILAPAVDAPSLLNTSGNVVPFGMRRMKVVELYGSLLCVSCDAINEALLEKGVFQQLLNAFFLYKWNNILQTSVMGMFHMVFHAERHDFCKTVLEQTDLIPRVSNLLIEDLRREKVGEPVSAYRGFFRSFSSTFLNLYGISDLTPVFDSYNEWKELLPLIDPKESDEQTTEVDEEAQTNATESETAAPSEEAAESSGAADSPSAEPEVQPACSDVVIEKNVENMDVDEPAEPAEAPQAETAEKPSEEASADVNTDEPVSEDTQTSDAAPEESATQETEENKAE